MKYYRVRKSDIYDPETGYTTIKNELLTEKERFKRFRGLSPLCFEIVDIKRGNIYTCFGARFEI